MWDGEIARSVAGNLTGHQRDFETKPIITGVTFKKEL